MPHEYTNTTIESVRTAVADGLTEAELLIERAVASVSAPSFDATMRPLDLAGAAALRGYAEGAFMAYVHTDSEVRDAGQAAEEEVQKWNVGLPFREDLSRAVRAFADTPEASSLQGEQKRLLEFWLRDFRRAGHELEPPAKAELEQLRQRLVELEVAFARNINDDQEGIEVTREQLAGLSDDYIERLSPGSEPGTYKVSI